MQRRGDGRCSSSTRSRWPIYIAGDRHLERGQQRVDRLRRRGRLGAVEGAVQRLLSAALQVPAVMIGATQVAGRDGPGRRSCSSSSIPPQFEHDLRAGRNPAIQVNIDATAMQQAGIGAGYIRNIINDRVATFLQRATERRRERRQPGRPQDVQPERRLVLVQERRGDHQSDHAADGRPDGRRGDPRARARHARAPAGDAADRVRDRDGQGVGQQPGDPGRDRRRRCSWSCRWC